MKLNFAIMFEGEDNNPERDQFVRPDESDGMSPTGWIRFHEMKLLRTLYLRGRYPIEEVQSLTLTRIEIH